MSKTTTTTTTTHTTTTHTTTTHTTHTTHNTQHTTHNHNHNHNNNSVAILAQDCPSTNREVYKFDGEVVEKVFVGSPREARQRRPTSACGEVRLTRASGDPSCFAGGGVHCIRANRVRGTCTCGEVHRARSCRVRGTCACGVHRACSSRVRGTSASVLELSPVPSVFQAPTPVVESVAPVPVVFNAPVFPLSPDASDTSSPEDEYTRSWESLPVPIKCFTQVESAEPLNLASETPTVFHGRELQAGRRDGLVGHALWLRKEAARRGYAWRQQHRARQLSSLRAACVPPGEMLARPCGTRLLEQASWWRRFGSWRREGRGRVRVARVLERVLATVAVRAVLDSYP